MITTIFGRMSLGLSRTRDSMVAGIRKLARTRSTVDQALLDDVEQILLSSDVGPRTTERIIEGVKQRVKEQGIASADDFTGLLKREMTGILMTDAGAMAQDPQKPHVIMVVGVNGAGKTTTVGKLAFQHASEGRRVLVGAADTFRAAANEQLERWVAKAGVEIVQQQRGADPAAVAFDTVQSARAREADVALIDTAGRLHTKSNLMEELGKIRRAVGKAMPGAPHEVLLVLDAGTGQNGMQQARQFSGAAGVTGVVLTKLDGTAKGGIVFAVRGELGIPVRYIGIGESPEDLQPFSPEDFVEALFSESIKP